MSGKKYKKAEKPGKSKTRESDDSETEVEEFDDQATWDCTVCTYKNRFEAFKCEMCDTRKGTSTRKPRLNMNVVQQQQILASALNETKTPKRKQRGMTPDSPQSLTIKRESSSSSLNHQMESLSPNDEIKEADKEMPSHKREKIRDSLVVRDAVKKYEITDSDGAAVTITALKSRQIDKELQLINSIRQLDGFCESRREKIEKARSLYLEEKKQFEDQRVRQRQERENRPKKLKKIKPKKPKKYITKTKLNSTLSSNGKKTGSLRGRPPNKNKTPTTTPKQKTPTSSKKK